MGVCALAERIKNDHFRRTVEYDHSTVSFGQCPLTIVHGKMGNGYARLSLRTTRRTMLVPRHRAGNGRKLRTKHRTQVPHIPSSNRDEGGREEEGTDHPLVGERLYVAGFFRFLLPVVQVFRRNMFCKGSTQSCISNYEHTRPQAVTVRHLGRDSKTVSAGRLLRGGVCATGAQQAW